MGRVVIAIMMGSIADAPFSSPSSHLLLYEFNFDSYHFTSAPGCDDVDMKQKKNYQKECEREFPRGRKAIIPFIL